jgi:hypothetical protein
VQPVLELVDGSEEQSGDHSRRDGDGGAKQNESQVGPAVDAP